MNSSSSTNSKSFLKGKVLFIQGEDAQNLYIVLKGAVKLFAGEGKNLVPVGVIREKDFFGEQSIFNGNPRTLTAVVAEDSELVLIHKKDINQVLKSCSGWVRDIMKLISDRLEDTHHAIYEHGLTDEIYAQNDLKISNEDLNTFKKNIEEYKSSRL